MVGELAALGSAALWALSGVVIKDIAGQLSAFYIMAVRTGVAALIALSAFALVGPDAAVLRLPESTLVLLLGSALLFTLGDTAFVRALAVEDVSRVFTVTTSLYILVSVTGSVVFTDESLSLLLVLGGLAVLIGARLVVHEQAGATDRPAARGRQPALALSLSVVAALLWATGLLAVSDAMESVDPLAANALRLPLMAIALGLIVGLRGEHRRGLKQHDLRLLALSGALVVGAMMLFLLSAKLSSVGTVAVLTSTSPIFVAPLAHFLLKERVTLRVAGGTMTCMVGIWLASV